jgi:hypothetical protein
LEELVVQPVNVNLARSRPAPEEVDGDAGGEDGEAEGAVEGVLIEGGGDDERAGGGEERGRERVSGDAEAAAAVGLVGA